MTRRLQIFDSISLAALVVAMCSQIDVRRIGRDTLAEGLGYATKTLSLALSDVVFALVFLWFVARCFQLRAWKRLWWPPLPCWALIFAMMLSALHSRPINNAVTASMAQETGFKNKIKAVLITHRTVTEKGKTKVVRETVKEVKEAIAEIAQWAGYFLVAPWIFVNLLHDRRGGDLISRRKLALKVFAIVAVLIVILSFVQLFTFEKSAPRALFGSANVFSGFWAIAFSLLISYLMQVQNPAKVQLVRSKSRRMFEVILFTLVVITGSLVVVSPWGLIGFCVGLIAAFFIARKDMVIVFPMGVFILILGTFQMPPLAPALRPMRADFSHVSSQDQKVKKQYREWQAAIGWNILREGTFATGIGPGNYQFNIGSFYGDLPSPPHEKMPPDSNNLYLVQAVSIGILGLGALLWVWGHFAGLAWQAAKKWPADWLGAGVLASLCAWAFVNLFHALIVRGAGLVLAFLFALAVIALEGQRNAEALQKSEKGNFSEV